MDVSRRVRMSKKLLHLEKNKEILKKYGVEIVYKKHAVSIN